MAEISISKKVKAAATERFTKKVATKITRMMTTRLLKAQREVEAVLMELIEEAIKNSPVYEGLDGRRSGSHEDLQAEFGLTKSMAREALNDLVRILKATINVNVSYTTGTNATATVKIKALGSDQYESQLKSGGSFSYISENDYNRSVKSKSGKKRRGKRVVEAVHTEYEIAWMTWLLEYSRDIVEQFIPSVKDYSIDYNLSKKRKSRSRSGRALMTTRKNRPGWTPYIMPVIAKPTVKGSKNFIEDIALDRRFKEIIISRVEKIVFAAFNPKKSGAKRSRGK